MTRPSLRAVFTNWSKSDAPFHEKLAMVARNNARKLVTLKDCCGHHGEPGC